MLYFEVSCKQCRMWHCKCDRTLPSCSQCIKRGLTCEYNPRKRKRMNKDEEEEEIADESSSSTPSSSSSSHFVVGEQTTSPTELLLRNELSQLHLPESYCSVNTQLIQFLLSETVQGPQFPLIKIIRRHLKSAYEYYQSSSRMKQQNVNYVKLAFLFSSQGLASMRLNFVEEAKNYLMAAAQILQKANILSYSGFLMKLNAANEAHSTHPIIASIIMQMVAISSVDGKLIQSSRLLLSFLQSYADLQKSRFAIISNQVKKNSMQERLQKNWYKISKLSEQNPLQLPSLPPTPPQQIQPVEDTFELDGFTFSREEILFQAKTFESLFKFFTLASLFIDDDKYFSHTVPELVALVLEVIKFRVSFESEPLITTILRANEATELKELCDSLTQFLANPNIKLQGTNIPHLFEQTIFQTLVCFEKLCSFLEAVWKQSSFPQNPAPSLFGFMIVMRGLRIRFIYELIEAMNNLEHPFKKVLVNLLISAATELIKILVNAQIEMNTVRNHFLIRRFAVDIALIHCEYVDSENLKEDAVELLQSDIFVLQQLRKSNFCDQGVEILMSQIEHLIELKSKQTVPSISSAESEPLFDFSFIDSEFPSLSVLEQDVDQFFFLQ